MGQTSKLPQIQVSSSNGKRNYMPLKHDVYATHRVGKIVPYMCRFFDANSKEKVNCETLEYNAPMVGPTVGDVKFKQWHYFVGLDKILPNFAEMFAKNPDLMWNLEQFVKSKVPQISLKYLSMLCLVGSYCTCYVTRVNKEGVNYLDPRFASENIGPVTAHNDVAMLIRAEYNESNNTWNEQYQNFQNFFGWMGAGTAWYSDHPTIESVIKRSIFSKLDLPFVGMDCVGININALNCSDTNWLAGINPPQLLGYIPLANPNEASLMDWYDNGKAVYSNPDEMRKTHGVDCSPVPFDNPDVRITRTRHKSNFASLGLAKGM